MQSLILLQFVCEQQWQQRKSRHHCGDHLPGPPRTGENQLICEQHWGRADPAGGQDGCPGEGGVSRKHSSVWSRNGHVWKESGRVDSSSEVYVARYTPQMLPTHTNMQLLLYDGAHVKFLNNTATEQGGGMYVEYTSSDFLLAVLNRGCFLQYYSTFVDIAPYQWVSWASCMTSAKSFRVVSLCISPVDKERQGGVYWQQG